MSSLIDALSPLPLLAILRGLPAARAPAVAERLFVAGIRVLEVPLNGEGALESVGVLARHFGDRALVGAGTVTRPEQVRDVVAAGGRFIVMPHGDPRVIEAAVGAGVPCIPGVATPTEAFAALSTGADALKLFPAEALPPTIVAAWKAVLPSDVWLLMVGSITSAALGPYRHAGARGFGLGSAIYRPDMTLDQIESAARAFVHAWSSLTSADSASSIHR
jgi:2-dehydro-3-deoxyphosphogalactonate aldolase